MKGQNHGKRMTNELYGLFGLAQRFARSVSSVVKTRVTKRDRIMEGQNQEPLVSVAGFWPLGVPALAV
jgi:hypothetical protein